MVTLVQSYKTSDGKVFDSETDAAGHEKYLELKEKIEAFIEAQGLTKKAAGSARKHIPAFMAFIQA